MQEVYWWISLAQNVCYQSLYCIPVVKYNIYTKPAFFCTGSQSFSALSSDWFKYIYKIKNNVLYLPRQCSQAVWQLCGALNSFCDHTIQLLLLSYIHLDFVR